jgi:hypothetical protein
VTGTHGNEEAIDYSGINNVKSLSLHKSQGYLKLSPEIRGLCYIELINCNLLEEVVIYGDRKEEDCI